MKKIKNKYRRPRVPLADHPVALKLEEMRGPFSLFEYPEPDFPDAYLSVFGEYDSPLESLKDSLAQIESREKNNLEARGWQEQPGELRKKIRLLEMVKKTDGKRPEGGMRRLSHAFKWAGRYHAELLYRLALDGDAEACEAFGDKAYEYFCLLKRIAIEDPQAHDSQEAFPVALRSLATLAIEATEVVNKHVVKNPDIFKLIATERSYWPFLKSLNKKLNPIKADDEDAILKKLNLGMNTQQDLTTKKRYDPENPAIKVAQKLLDYVREIRRSGQYLSELKRSSKLNVKTTPVFMKAENLPEVTKAPNAANAWWNLAKYFLLESYPKLDPKANAPLKAVAPTLLALSQVKNSRDRKKRILYNLERAFKNILAKSPPTPPMTGKEWFAQAKLKNPELLKRLE